MFLPRGGSIKHPIHQFETHCGPPVKTSSSPALNWTTSSSCFPPSSCSSTAAKASRYFPPCWPAERKSPRGAPLRSKTERSIRSSTSGGLTRAAWRRPRASWTSLWVGWSRWASGSWAWPSGWRRWRSWHASDDTVGRIKAQRRSSWRSSRLGKLFE